jgi:hypothetical protein
VFLSDRTLSKAKNLGSATLTWRSPSARPARYGVSVSPRGCGTFASTSTRSPTLPPGRARPCRGRCVCGTTMADRAAVRHHPRQRRQTSSSGAFRHVWPVTSRRSAGGFGCSPHRRTGSAGSRHAGGGRVAVTRRCAVCGDALPALARSEARYFSVRCRVAAHRHRQAVARLGGDRLQRRSMRG